MMTFNQVLKNLSLFILGGIVQILFGGLGIICMVLTVLVLWKLEDKKITDWGKLLPK